MAEKSWNRSDEFVMKLEKHQMNQGGKSRKEKLESLKLIRE